MTKAELELLELLEEDCWELIRVLNVIKQYGMQFDLLQQLTTAVGKLRGDLIRICSGELLSPGDIELATIKRLDFIKTFLYESKVGELKLK